MMSEKKLSIFRPVYSKVGSRWGKWLHRNQTNNCDVIYRRGGPWRPVSIYNHIHTLIWFLGFGIAWGFAYDKNGNHYIQKEHLVRWDHCEYNCIASRVWFGRMEIFV